MWGRYYRQPRYWPHPQTPQGKFPNRDSPNQWNIVWLSALANVSDYYRDTILLSIAIQLNLKASHSVFSAKRLKFTSILASHSANGIRRPQLRICLPMSSQTGVVPKNREKKHVNKQACVFPSPRLLQLKSFALCISKFVFITVELSH